MDMVFRDGDWVVGMRRDDDIEDVGERDGLMML